MYHSLRVTHTPTSLLIGWNCVIYIIWIILWRSNVCTFLLCHTCCDITPQLLQSHSKDHLNVVIFNDKQGVRWNFSNPGPKWYNLNGKLTITKMNIDTFYMHIFWYSIYRFVYRGKLHNKQHWSNVPLKKKSWIII